MSPTSPTFLGRTGPAASRIGLGCGSFSGVYGPVDQRAAADILAFALDQGVALIDSAGCALGDAGRRPVHRLIAARREQIVLTGHLRPADEAGGAVAACEALLRRMRVDHIDLCFLDAGFTGLRLEDRVSALAGLIAAGKVRHLGLREASGAQLRLAHRIHPVAALAVEYSLIAREPEIERLPAARELGVAVVGTAPLGRGLLTGRDLAAAGGGSPARATLRRLQAVAADLDVGMPRLALAWLLSRGPDIIPVPSTGNRVHLEMNLMATRMTAPAGALDRLTEASTVARGEDRSGPLDPTA